MWLVFGGILYFSGRGEVAINDDLLECGSD